MATTYIQRTNGTPDSRKKFTFSFWVKRAKLGTYQYVHGFQDNGVSDPRMTLTFRDNDSFEYNEGNSSGTELGRLRTSRKFRDTSAWYAITVAVDTTLATADDRIKIWVNGVQETAFDNRVNYTQNLDTCIDDNRHTIGAIYNSSLSGYFDGSLSHYHYCDNYAYQASNFGSTDATTGEWKINTSPSVSYGTNGCFVLKDGNSVTDASPNSNNFTAGGTLTKTEDCPDNVFATMNPLDKNTNVVLENGNTTSYSSANNTWVAANRATLGIAKDKFYWEMKITGSGTANGLFFGVCADTVALITSQGIQDNATEKAKGILLFCDDGQSQLDTNSRASMTSAPAFNDVLGCAVDRDNNIVKFYKNGSEVGSIDISLSLIHI